LSLWTIIQPTPPRGAFLARHFILLYGATLWEMHHLFLLLQKRNAIHLQIDAVIAQLKPDPDLSFAMEAF